MTGDIPAGLPAIIDYMLEVEAGAPVQVILATCVVKDSAGGAVSGSPFNCTISPATAAVEIILTFPWTSPTAGQYKREYVVTYFGGSQKTFPAPLLIVTEPNPGDVSTYDLSTNIGKCRFWANDKNANDPEFSDPEIQLALDRSSTDPVLAAIMLLELRAAKYVREGVVAKVGGRMVDARQRSAQMLELSKYLRSVYEQLPYVDEVTQVFVPDYVSGVPVTTMDPW